MFSHAKISAAEKAVLAESVRYEIIDGTERLQFPCRQLGNDGACGCYDTRPAKCQSFQCRLLRRFGRDEVTFGQCEELVAETKAVRNRIRDDLKKAAAHLESVVQEGRISRAMRALKSAEKSKDQRIEKFYATRAKLRFDFYKQLINTYFNSGYY